MADLQVKAAGRQSRAIVKSSANAVIGALCHQRQQWAGQRS